MTVHYKKKRFSFFLSFVRLATVFFHPMPVFILVARSVGKSAQHSKLKLKKENRCAIFVWSHLLGWYGFSFLSCSLLSECWSTATLCATKSKLACLIGFEFSREERWLRKKLAPYQNKHRQEGISSHLSLSCSSFARKNIGMTRFLSNWRALSNTCQKNLSGGNDRHAFFFFFGGRVTQVLSQYIPTVLCYSPILFLLVVVWNSLMCYI